MKETNSKNSINDYSYTQQDRYDSLKSLYRLVEDDLAHQTLNDRRASLPVQRSSLNLYTTGVKWRNSSVTDYIHALTSTQASIIQRLLPGEKVLNDKTVGAPNISTERCSNSKGIIPKANTFHGDPVKIDQDDEATASDDDAIEYPTLDDNLCDSAAVEKAIDDLRERVARFEALKNVSRTVHADDFQQFLSQRYLEIYQKRQNSRVVPKMPNIKNYRLPTAELSHRRTSGLNVKLHAVARRLSKRYDQVSELKVILPPISQNNSTGECSHDLRQLEKETQPDSNKSNNTNHDKIVPIQNDLTDEYLKIYSRPGIPHHAANRALSRSIQSRRLKSVFYQLHRFPKTAD